MTRDIVVGLDGSPSSTNALTWALAAAARDDAGVRAVHAWATPVWLEAPGFGFGILPAPDELERCAQAVLDQQLAGLDTGTTEVTPVLREGDAKRELVDEAKDAGLLVVGSRGTGAARGIHLGSVTSYALRHAECPVVVVPDDAAAYGAVKRVIVGIDGSEASRAAMRWALDSAERHGCPLVVVHAWLLPTLPSSIPLNKPPGLPEYPREAQDWLHKELQEGLPDHGDVPVTTELVYGSPSWALLNRAGADDELVLGRRGGGGFAELLLGSVTSQCAHHARGVVVVVEQPTVR